MSKANEMLIAVNSGFVDDGGEAREITAGLDRIAPEVLRERPQYREFFDPAVSAPGTNAVQARYRITLPGGEGVVAA